MALPSDRNLRKSSKTQRETARITKKDSNVVNFHSLCDFVYGCHNDRMKVCGRWFFLLVLFLNKSPVVKTRRNIVLGPSFPFQAPFFTDVNCHWAIYTLMRKRSKESSPSLFLIGRKRTVNYFRNQRLRCHLTADYTIIMSRTLKVTGNHVMYNCGAWFLRVIMSSSRFVACWFLYFYMFKNDYQFHLLSRLFTVVTKVSVRVIGLSLRLRVITPISTLIILDITKTLSNNYLL